MDSRARMMLDALNSASAQVPTQQGPGQQEPMRYAEGGMVGGLPSLEDLSRPDFNWSSLNKFSPAPSSFTPMMQNVPMFVADSPAYGSMGTDVYDWKAPTATAAPQPYTTVNQPTAITRNRRVPTQTATVDVQMPTYEAPPPVVPTPEYVPTMPGTGGTPVQEPVYTAPPVEAPYTPSAPVAPPAAEPVFTPAAEPVFTPVEQPLGPTPEEVRRTEAAKELEAFNKRQAELAEQKRIADEAEARRVEEQAIEQQRLARLEEEKRAADKLLADQQLAETNRLAEQKRLADEAEAKRIADEKAATAAAVIPVEQQVMPSQFITTNQDSGGGYDTGPMTVAQMDAMFGNTNWAGRPTAAAPAQPVQEEASSSWYSGDGG